MRFIEAFQVSSKYLVKAGFTVTKKETTAQPALQSLFTVGVLVGGKGAALGAGAKVGVEDDIAVASIRFKLAVELNIYSELIEEVCILLRI